MKKIFTFYLTLTFTFVASSSFSAIDPDSSSQTIASDTVVKAGKSGLSLTGVYELQIGKSYEAVKHLLDKDPVEKHYSVLEREYYIQQKWEIEEEIVKNAYTVKKTEKKYYTVHGIPVKSIEVRFDKKKQVIGILIMIEKSKKNVSFLKEKLSMEFNISACAQAVGDEMSFYCGNPDPENEVKLNFYTFDGIGEYMINDYFYIRFCKSTEDEDGCY
ncbi:MAG: hypothetical protein ACJ75J_17940 [Cytophagaceae bacterium]